MNKTDIFQEGIIWQISWIILTGVVDMLYMGVILSDYGRFSTALDESGRMIRDRVFEN